MVNSHPASRLPNLLPGKSLRFSVKGIKGLGLKGQVRRREKHRAYVCFISFSLNWAFYFLRCVQDQGVNSSGDQCGVAAVQFSVPAKVASV